MKENHLSTIFPKRLKQARTAARMSMDELVTKMGMSISKQSISKYEKGVMMPSSNIMLALANALDCDINFLIRPFLFNGSDLNLSFRKKTSLGVKDVKALKVNVEDKIERYLEVEEILGILADEYFKTETTHLISKIEDMTECADNVRNSWNLGLSPIANIMTLLESKGVKVIETKGPDGFDGVSGIVNGKYMFIVVNTQDISSERVRFTLLHELAHLLFNENMSDRLKPLEIEKMCNAFASEMLLPAETLKKYLCNNDKLALSELIELQKYYGISIDAIMHKLHTIGIVSDSRYKWYCIRKKREPMRSVVEESRYPKEVSNHFESLVCKALAQNLITESKASSLLNGSVAKIKTTII